MLRVKLTSRGAEGMTTVWRPRVRIPVPDIDGADADENRRDELTKKGTKRKRAPLHKGAVRARGEDRARSARCAALVRTVVGAMVARSAVGREYASTVVSALNARSAVGQGICEHGRERSRCKECGGGSICEHGRQRTRCKECGGASICEHGRERSRCKECGGGAICEHGRQRSSARSAVVHQSASTVVGATGARSAVQSRLLLVHASISTTSLGDGHCETSVLLSCVYHTNVCARVSRPTGSSAPARLT